MVERVHGWMQGIALYATLRIPLHATLLCACRSPRLASRGAQRGTVTGH